MLARSSRFIIVHTYVGWLYFMYVFARECVCVCVCALHTFLLIYGFLGKNIDIFSSIYVYVCFCMLCVNI